MMMRLIGSGVAAGARRLEGWGMALVLHLLALVWETGRGDWRSRRRLGNASQMTPGAFAPCGTAAITQTSPKHRASVYKTH